LSCDSKDEKENVSKQHHDINASRGEAGNFSIGIIDWTRLKAFGKREGANKIHDIDYCWR